jgi:mannosylglycerate hydrolase
MGKYRRTLHLIPHTRWRREWHLTYQQTRLRLVALIDKLLDILEADPGYQHFTLDGQTILLDDYLEIRPERAETIRRHVQSGRLLIGPWYIIPDEFLVGPEALIRNLLEGIRGAGRFGPCMDVGYLPDSCGHIGQLPQILRGFGIDAAALISGLGDQPLELWWESPDGSRVLLCHLRDGPDNAADLPTDQAAFNQAIQRLRDDLIPYAQTRHLPLLNGADPQPEIPALMAGAQSELGRDRLMHSSLPTYIGGVRRSRAGFPAIYGELRSSQRQPLLRGTLSARMWIKQRNHAVETLLAGWAEPFSAWAGLGNGSAGRLADPVPAVRHAWRLLMHNHAPASIGGYSADQVHEEMRVRFDQAEQIGQEITRQSLISLAERADTSALPADNLDGAIVVFNSGSHTRSDVVAAVQQPAPSHPFRLIDEAGSDVPFEFEQSEGAVLRFVACDVPPLGYRSYGLAPADELPTNPTMGEGWRIENDRLRVDLDPDTGTLTLTDLDTGQAFGGLNRFVDGGDIGDLGNYCPPQRDTPIEVPANTRLYVERGVTGVRQWLYYVAIYRVPLGLTSERDARRPMAAQFGGLPIEVRLELMEGVPRLDVQVSVQNSVVDHRLRVHFPTGIQAEFATYDGHFEVIQRPIRLPDDTDEWGEQPTYEHPQRAFVDVSDSSGGLTVTNRGLPEAAVLPTDTGAEIALTLLRCVGWLSRDDLPCRAGHIGPPLATPGGQCLGQYTYRYSLIPHGPDPLPAWQEAWAFQDLLRAVVTAASPGPLPPTASLVQADNPAFVVSAVKWAEDGDALIVRGYNLSRQVETVRLRMGHPFGGCRLARLDETPTGNAIQPDPDGAYRFDAPPAGVVTLRFDL